MSRPSVRESHGLCRDAENERREAAKKGRLSLSIGSWVQPSMKRCIVIVYFGLIAKKKEGRKSTLKIIVIIITTTTFLSCYNC